MDPQNCQQLRSILRNPTSRQNNSSAVTARTKKIATTPSTHCPAVSPAGLLQELEPLGFVSHSSNNSILEQICSTDSEALASEIVAHEVLASHDELSRSPPLVATSSGLPILNGPLKISGSLPLVSSSLEALAVPSVAVSTGCYSATGFSPSSVQTSTSVDLVAENRNLKKKLSLLNNVLSWLKGKADSVGVPSASDLPVVVPVKTSPVPSALSGRSTGIQLPISPVKPTLPSVGVAEASPTVVDHSCWSSLFKAKKVVESQLSPVDIGDSRSTKKLCLSPAMATPARGRIV